MLITHWLLTSPRSDTITPTLISLAPVRHVDVKNFSGGGEVQFVLTCVRSMGNMLETSLMTATLSCAV